MLVRSNNTRAMLLSLNVALVWKRPTEETIGPIRKQNRSYELRAESIALSGMEKDPNKHAIIYTLFRGVFMADSCTTIGLHVVVQRINMVEFPRWVWPLTSRSRSVLGSGINIQIKFLIEDNICKTIQHTRSLSIAPVMISFETRAWN